MRLTKYSFVMVCATLIGTIGLVHPSFVPAAEDRFAAYYQPADEEMEDDEPETDEAPPDDSSPPEEMNDDEPSDEMPEDDAPPAEVPDDEPRERLPSDDARDEATPPTPQMEDQAPADTAPVHREPAPDGDSTFTPKYDSVFPGDHYGATGKPKGWGYNGGCCAGVWDGYCEEGHGCHHCRCGRGKFWCRIMCRKAKIFGCRNKRCGRHQGSCCRQASAPSCCRAPTNSGGDESVSPAVPPAPVPPAPVPYDSAAKPKPGQKGSSVVRKQWDMPRMKPKAGTTRK